LIQQIQARLLAAQGRGGDTEVAHVTPGELGGIAAFQESAIVVGKNLFAG